ncbi:unnamed protein product [Lepeophtheirus salmonis]|uniref:(salmon louse) hypothetical protein n=1 Tax=Lepeophtheirus salmonis TaxID=72036 RepID=A0A7R8H574_LEPSM|nr:unnamed protein product [Lepeophtheirus salmonis]CAF2871541.1 unnamed protein product [Lepeophtheirus salmonis]
MKSLTESYEDPVKMANAYLRKTIAPNQDEETIAEAILKSSQALKVFKTTSLINCNLDNSRGDCKTNRMMGCQTRVSYQILVLYNLIILTLNARLIASELHCWKCASVDKQTCPENAVIVPAGNEFNACVTWRLGNGTVILQNVVKFEQECTQSKIAFWSKFINMYYGGNEKNSASVACCQNSGCNTGIKKREILYPGPPLDEVFSSSSPSQILSRQRHYLPDILRRMDGAPSYRVPYNPYSYSSDPFNNYLQAPSITTHNPIEAALSKVTQSHCQKYFSSTSAEEWLPRNLIPLTVDRASGAKVGVFYTKFNSLQNNNDHFIVRIIDESKSNETMYTFKLYNVGSISLFVSEYKKGPIRNDEISLGKIGDTLVKPLIMWNDTYSKGPKKPYFLGITTPKSSSASFGASCEANNLHFSDTCITDEDCSEYPKTICRKDPIDPEFDQGGRDIPYDEWEKRNSILKTCFCKKGHIRIRGSKGCYDPVRSVITLKEACFSDHHCESLPNTASDRVPKRVTDFVYDDDEEAYIASVQIKFKVDPFSPNSKNVKGYSDVAVIKILNKYKSGDKMLSVSFDRSDAVEDMKTLKLMEKEFVGFWIMYSFKKGFGGTMSIGLNGVPINIENSLVSWTDTSDSVLEKPVYIGFTTENEGSTVDFGATCMIKKESNCPPHHHEGIFVKEEGTIHDWQLNSGSYSDPLMHQQYLEKLSKILPQYYEDDKTLQDQSLFRDIEPLNGGGLS